MASEPNSNAESVAVEVMPDNPALMERQSEEKTNEIKEETLALMEAIRTKAQAEAKKAGDFARDSYLDAVRKAKEEVDKLNLFEPKRIEDALKQVQEEVEKDWDAVAKQVTSLGDRLNEAAKAAWEKLTASHSE